MRAVPWTFRQTLLGTGLTVAPLVALLAAQNATPAAPLEPLAPAVDRASAVVTGITAALVECVFLIAPLYFALKGLGGAAPTAAPTLGEPPAAPGLPSAASPGRAALRALGLRGFSVLRALVLVAAGLVAIDLFGTLYDLLRVPTNVDALLRDAQRAPLTTLATRLVAVIVAPVCEEIFFRGFLLSGLMLAMPAWAAVLASALVFGFAHADPGSFLPLVMIGVVLGVLRLRSGSLWPGIALHTLNNLNAAIFVLTALHH